MDFISGELYHIYNRGNNADKIFLHDRNYLFFENKIEKELLPYCDVLAYCLMPNHYHLLVEVKDVEMMKAMHPLSRKIGTLQSSYSQAINKQDGRVGSLFQQRAKSKNVEDYGLICFHYIHQNPVRAKLVLKMSDWKHSSYLDYAGNRESGIVNKRKAYQLLEISDNHERFCKESLEMVITDTHTKSIC